MNSKSVAHGNIVLKLQNMTAIVFLNLLRNLLSQLCHPCRQDRKGPKIKCMRVHYNIYGICNVFELMFKHKIMYIIYTYSWLYKMKRLNIKYLWTLVTSCASFSLFTLSTLSGQCVQVYCKLRFVVIQIWRPRLSDENK